LGRLERPENELHDQIARLVETGRLEARFLPLFLDDPRRPGEVGLLRIYRLGGGPPNAPAPRQRSASAPRPPPVLSRPATEVETDFPNEPAQVATLQQAAKDGTPFCAICEALKAQRRAEQAGATA
jgi:hypothetical protein